MMEAAAVKAMIYQARDAWITGDANAFASLFAATGELVVPGKRWQGPVAIAQVVNAFAVTHAAVKIEIHRILIDGAVATVEWSWEDIEPATGTHTQAEDAIVIDFKDGQIQRWREYIDFNPPE